MPSGALQITAISGLRRNVPAAAPREDEICKYIDVTTCIGSKACEVAWVEWNDMPFQRTTFQNTYQTLPSTAWKGGPRLRSHGRCAGNLPGDGSRHRKRTMGPSAPARIAA